MKKTLQAVAMITLVGILGSSGYAFAQEFEDLAPEEVEMIEHMRERKEKMRKKMREDLGVTEEQQQKLEKHRGSHRGQIKEYMEKMMDFRDKLKTELEKAEIDTAKVYGLHDQIKVLENEMADHRLEGILQLCEILTPEQFRKFHDKAGKMMGKSGRFHGVHKSGPGEFMPKRP